MSLDVADRFWIDSCRALSESDDACLAFHKSTRAVKTASVVQVRRPVYKTSVERWRRYGDGLAPLLEALNYTPPDAKPAAKPAPKKPAAKKAKTG